MFLNGKVVEFISGEDIKLKNKRIYVRKYTRGYYGLKWVTLEDRKKRLINITTVYLTKESFEATTAIMLNKLQQKENAND